MIEIEPIIVPLSNGIRLVYMHTPSPVAHMGVTVLAGSRYEQSQEAGLAHFLEHCIFKGTTKRRSLHILSRLDSVGGELNAYTTKEEICVYASFTKEYFKRSSELLADIVLNSNFPEKEIQKEKEDVPLTKLVQTIEKDFSTLKRSALQVTPLSFTDYKPFQIRSQEGNFQAHAVIGGIAPGYNNEQRRGMTLLTNVLGGPALNSRLILTIREKYGYTYNIEASYSPYADIGYWTIYFGTDQKYLEKTRKLVYKEIKLMREEALSEIQLKKAKEQLKGHLALSLDSNSGIMLGLGKSLLLFNQIDSIQEIYSAIDKLTVKELREIAAEYFDESKVSELIFEVTED